MVGPDIVDSILWSILFQSPCVHTSEAMELFKYWFISKLRWVVVDMLVMMDMGVVWAYTRAFITLPA